MRTFLKYTGIFALLFTIPCIIIEVMLRQIPNSYVFKKKLIETQGKRMRTIVIGSSVTNCGIIPSELGDSTYNLSISGQWIPYNRLFLEKYVNKMPQVKHIIWGIAYQTLWLEDTFEQDKISINHHAIYLNIPEQWNLMHHIELLNSSIALRKWSKYYITHKRTMWCDSLGTDHSYDLSEKSCGWKEDITRRVKEQTIPLHQESERIMTDNLRHIDAVGTLCQQKNIRICLVIPPVYKDYRAQMDSSHVNIIRNKLKEVVEKHKQIILLDYLDDTRFDDDDFYDGSHLSSDKGAYKFTRILKEDLQL